MRSWLNRQTPRSPATTGPAAQSDSLPEGDADMTKDKTSKKKLFEPEKMKNPTPRCKPARLPVETTFGVFFV
jgi:hypothetical protein